MITTLRPHTGGELVRQLRRHAGLSQRELAQRLGKPQSMIARWERGHDSPRIESLWSIAQACGVELDVTVRAHDDVDRTQIRAQLRLTPSQRLANTENVAELRSIARRAR